VDAICLDAGSRGIRRRNQGEFWACRRSTCAIERSMRAIEQQQLDAEPAVLTLLREERARVERMLGLAASTAASLKSLKSLRRKLYPYQREGVKRFFERGRLLLADDMGLGKTTQAIAACHGLLASHSIERGLLVIPPALKPQWLREWESTSDAPLTLVEGSPKERARLYAGTRRGFLAIGYEQLLRDFAQVQRFAPQLVVLDEAQRIKNWATVRRVREAARAGVPAGVDRYADGEPHRRAGVDHGLRRRPCARAQVAARAVSHAGRAQW
jgi:hypothetical protein